MDEVECVRISLKPGSIPAVREWAETVGNSRRAEALETMAQEGVSVESYFLESGPDEDSLIAYIRADSLERAARIAARSSHEIDRYHQEMKRKTWAERIVLEPLVDLVIEH